MVTMRGSRTGVPGRTAMAVVSWDLPATETICSRSIKAGDRTRFASQASRGVASGVCKHRARKTRTAIPGRSRPGRSPEGCRLAHGAGGDRPSR